MRKLQDILDEEINMGTIVQLTGIFEAIASTHIAEIKDQVLQAQNFFNELWKIYSQIRVDKLFRFGRQRGEEINPKELFIIITSSGGFSGDIDQRLVSEMIRAYNPANNDIIVIGYHGTVLLSQAGVGFKKFYKLPEKSQNLNVDPLVKGVRSYKNTRVFYQQYESLTTQNVMSIELGTALKELSANRTEQSDEIISDLTYIFEPSPYDVIAHLERSMIQIALGQVIFSSQLAQYASRFRAMTLANNRAVDSLTDLSTLYNRSKREKRDNQLKQIINDLRIINNSRNVGLV